MCIIRIAFIYTYIIIDITIRAKLVKPLTCLRRQESLHITLYLCVFPGGKSS